MKHALLPIILGLTAPLASAFSERDTLIWQCTTDKQQKISLVNPWIPDSPPTVYIQRASEDESDVMIEYHQYLEKTYFHKNGEQTQMILPAEGKVYIFEEFEPIRFTVRDSEGKLLEHHLCERDTVVRLSSLPDMNIPVASDELIEWLHDVSSKDLP